MKVKLLTGRAGANFSNAPGDVIDVSKDEGQRMIDAGVAVPVVEKREKAVKSAPEKRG